MQIHIRDGDVELEWRTTRQRPRRIHRAQQVASARMGAGTASGRHRAPPHLRPTAHVRHLVARRGREPVRALEARENITSDDRRDVRPPAPDAEERERELLDAYDTRNDQMEARL